MVTRFAPSPTGLLHLGHAFAAQVAREAAKAAGGTFLLRLEDIDFTRCRPEYEEALYEDLEWLGFDWKKPVLKQSARLPVYAEALSTLQQIGVLYPCFCTRREMALAVSAPHGASPLAYPGTCRDLAQAKRDELIGAGQAHAWRLDAAKALSLTGPLLWRDEPTGVHPVSMQTMGDVVLARKDVSTSYHLAVTVDDAEQQVTLVTRGKDLLDSTNVHRLLQALLGLQVPVWHHHPLIGDAEGRRLAKRDGARSVRAYRMGGQTANEVLALLNRAPRL